MDKELLLKFYLITSGYLYKEEELVDINNDVQIHEPDRFIRITTIWKTINGNIYNRSVVYSIIGYQNFIQHERDNKINLILNG